MFKLNMFALFGLLFLSSALLASGIYSSNQIYAQKNEAEVNADIEQENKCKPDTECENENKINNQLSITNITQVQQEPQTPKPQTTLNVIKTVQCHVSGVSQELCNNIGPEDFQFDVTNINNTFPNIFPGSADGTLVTTEEGQYLIFETSNFSPPIPPGIQIGVGGTIEGDCNPFAFGAWGTILEGEAQECIFNNEVFLTRPG